MTRIGLMLMLVCAIAGGMFQSWNSQSKPVPVAKAVAPITPKVKTEKGSVHMRGGVDYGPYMSDLQRRIKKQWFPPKADQSDKIKVVFKVHSDGTATNTRLTRPSKSKAASQAALNAVSKASPFRPLPRNAPNDIDIEFTFDYNVLSK